MQKKYKNLKLYALVALLVVLLCGLLHISLPVAFGGAANPDGWPQAGHIVGMIAACTVVVGICFLLARRLRPTRTVLALMFIIGITLLFVDFTGTVRGWTGWMAKLQLLPSLLAINVAVVVFLLLLTLIFGRVYCSVICPMGVLQDVIARLGRIHKRNPYSYSKAKSVLRYSLLIVFVALFVAGLSQIAILIAPYSAFGRIAQNLLQPVWIFGNNLLASVAASMDSYTFHHADLWIRSVPTFIIAAVTLVVVAILAWRNGRTWCNTICPVGTVLGFISRFSWLKIHFDADACRKCGKCSRNCKASCIDFKTHTVDYSRCVACGDCLEQCAFNALHYGHTRKGSGQLETAAEKKQPTTAGTQPKNDAIDNGRRTFLVAAAMATSAAAMAQKDKKVDGGLAVIEKKVAPKRHTPLTPPGSWSADHFAQHCTACQLCVAECPNGVLRPSTELSTLMQPTMSYERGFCRPECTRCSEVCPTGAIKPITKAEKSSTQIGHAVWIMHNCVVVTDKVSCGNCSRHCPAGAIEMVNMKAGDPTSPLIPTVNEARCIGCGACEYVCPARPFSAIHVEGHEVHRTI